jgi:hypothetical protein
MENLKEKISSARKDYGDEVVNVVIEMVQMSDADGAYVIFEDNEMFDHAEVVSLLYFED